MKNDKEKTNVMRILDQKKIKYDSYTYEVDLEHLDGIHVAQSLGQDLTYVYKTLVCISNTKHYYVLVVNVADEIDFKKAAKELNEKSLELISVKDIETVTGGYVRGGTSPIGMKKLYKTLIEEGALSLDHIIISAGKRGYQVSLNPKDLAKLINARFALFRRENEE